MKEPSHMQIFLSYASPDQERVLQVYDYLIKNGYPNAWIDCKKLLPGQPWEFEILRNLRKSEIVLIFLSHAMVNKRGFVQNELKTSLRYLEEKLHSDTYIIPIKLDSNVLVPEELTKVHALDFERPDALNLLKQSLDAQTEKLGFTIIHSEEAFDKIHTSKKIITEKWEGLPGYEVEFSLPIFHSTTFENIHEITKLIEARYIKSLHFYRLHKVEQCPNLFSWAQFYFQRTNTFDAHYSNLFHKNNFLSIVYTVSWYGAGAAHPNHLFETFNFLLTPLIEIGDITMLFIHPDKSFPVIQAYVRKALLDIAMEVDETGNRVGKERLLDEEWVNKGTDNWECFSAFAFSEEGLSIYFPQYQVGAYACGSHNVNIPYDYLSRHFKLDFRHALFLPAND